MRGKNLIHCLGYLTGLSQAHTQTTPGERELLMQHARGRSSLVEIGVMNGVNTSLLRSKMAEGGTITGIDPFPPGSLGISLELVIARRELSRHRRGRALLLRKLSHEASSEWTTPIDFLFIDGDHSWDGIDRDWRDWSDHVIPGGIVALHDTRSVSWRPDLDSVRYLREVIQRDLRFREIDAVDSLTVLERVT
ncbi:MAG: class I SAM-dependent methyltransferase [Planctomycetaceae bacterium]